MNLPVKAVVIQRLAAPAERVYDAWLDPAWIGRWMFGSGAGEERIVRLGVEPRVRGKFSFVLSRHGREIDHLGEYLELDRPGLLVFTWTTRDTLPDTSRVVVEIVPCAGGCELTLTHVMGAVWAHSLERISESWYQRLGALGGALAETNPLILQQS